jgi:maltooligosyltrehalose trehalohydrolase
MRRHHELPFGAEPTPDGVRFRLWAPSASAVSLRIEDVASLAIPMAHEEDGRFSLTTAVASPGTRYRYIIAGKAVPDPALRRQPAGVHGPSEVVDPAEHVWSDLDWRGRRREEIVFYELHLGTFCDTGDFAGAIRHLDHIQKLGATAVELMPIAEFPGLRNWGYDGVFLYALLRGMARRRS